MKNQEWPARTATVLWFLAVAAEVVAGAHSHSAVNDSKVSAFYLLGDSSVDCGENSLLNSLFHQNRSLHPCQGSDRSLIPHLLAKKMDFPAIPPFSGQDGSVDGIMKGLNFGSPQATIISSGSHEFQSLNHQLRQALESFQLLELLLTPPKSRRFLQSSVTYLSFGKDDYIDIFLHNSSSIMRQFTGREFARILVNQMTSAIKSLYGANLRKIVCVGILPLGCTPRTVWEMSSLVHRSYGGRTRCVEEINELVLEYNKLLENRIVSLNKELPESMIIFCDVYQGMMDIINNPDRHGFKDVTRACCGLGSNGGVVGCLYMDMACEEASTHVWWDFYNPTNEVNRILADSAWSGQQEARFCRPRTVQELVSASRSSSSYSP